jgi:uncharacterized protein
MSRVVHFEIPANDTEKAVEFYKNVFNWEISKWEGPMEYWLVKTGDAPAPGIDGAIYKISENMNKPVNTIGVGNLEETIQKIKENGGQVITEIMPIPGIGIMVYALDREANIFGVLQPEMTK